MPLCGSKSFQGNAREVEPQYFSALQKRSGQSPARYFLGSLKKKLAVFLFNAILLVFDN